MEGRDGKKARGGKEGKNFPLFFLSIAVLMVLCVACSDSPVEENNQDQEVPDLEKILKDMVLIPASGQIFKFV